jgi:hypothetical protein
MTYLRTLVAVLVFGALASWAQGAMIWTLTGVEKESTKGLKLSDTAATDSISLDSTTHAFTMDDAAGTYTKKKSALRFHMTDAELGDMILGFLADNGYADATVDSISHATGKKPTASGTIHKNGNIGVSVSAHFRITIPELGIDNQKATFSAKLRGPQELAPPPPPAGGDDTGGGSGSGGAGSGGDIPEPTTLVLLSIAAIGLLRKRNSRA